MFGFGKKDKIKPVVVLVLDGFGIAPETPGNAISLANTPNYDRMLTTYPHGQLIASGESVGLPANEVGNTEVGHLTIGAGRVIFQDLMRINKAVKDGSMAGNPALVAAVSHVKQNKTKLHLMGLVGTGQVHSSMYHLQGILNALKQHQVEEVYVHAFTDGRDSHPKAGAKVVMDLERSMKEMGVGRFASVTGRYYAMDRDRRWERIEETYNALVLGEGQQGESISHVLETNYTQGTTDEFVKPTLIVKDGRPLATIDDGDAVIHFNFRVDRPKELTTALVLKDFESFRSYDAGFDEGGNLVAGKQEFEQTFERKKVLANFCIVTMTEYHKNLPVSGVMFEPQILQDSMTAVVDAAGGRHLHMAESEKERFVKFYMNGMQEEPLPLETSKIVKSPKIATYDKKPEMSVYKLTKVFEKEIGKGKYQLAVMNFANPDMVAHTGKLKATVKAVEHTDKAIGMVEKKVLAMGGTLIMTADHGNAEDLLTYPSTGFFYTAESGGVNTEHSSNPVPVIVMSSDLAGKPVELPKGSLADVAPTVLKLLGLVVPEGMTGIDLLDGVK